MGTYRSIVLNISRLAPFPAVWCLLCVTTSPTQEAISPFDRGSLQESENRISSPGGSNRTRRHAALCVVLLVVFSMGLCVVMDLVFSMDIALFACMCDWDLCCVGFVDLFAWM